MDLQIDCQQLLVSQKEKQDTVCFLVEEYSIYKEVLTTTTTTKTIRPEADSAQDPTTN